MLYAHDHCTTATSVTSLSIVDVIVCSHMVNSVFSPSVMLLPVATTSAADQPLQQRTTNHQYLYIDRTHSCLVGNKMPPATMSMSVSALRLAEIKCRYNGGEYLFKKSVLWIFSSKYSVYTRKA